MPRAKAARRASARIRSRSTPCCASAVATAPAGKGTTVLTIKVKNLKKGAENGILFGCNPHSHSDNGEEVEMLGVIVLDAD